MTVLQAVVLGIVQGATEFLPVSSSGHLALVPALLGWEEHPVAFDAFLHLGTLLAVFFVLREEILRILKGLFKKDDAWGRLGWMIAAASVPVLAVGFVMSEVLSIDVRGPEVIAFSLAFWGIALYAADRFAGAGEAKAERTGWKRALLIGLAQTLALIPGTSRSGVTITAGRALGLSRTAAARFSFLLGIPAISAAGALAIIRLSDGSAAVPLVPALAGFLASFVAGALAIRWLLVLLTRVSYAPFAAYRLVLAAAVVLLLI